MLIHGSEKTFKTSKSGLEGREKGAAEFLFEGTQRQNYESRRIHVVYLNIRISPFKWKSKNCPTLGFY